MGLNMNAQNMTLVSVGCYLGCAILIVIGGKAMDLGSVIIVLYILNLLFWAIFPATFHSRVKKLSKTLNIVWP
jgi:hypothetical protein